MTAKDKMRQALNEQRQGVPASVLDSRLFVEKDLDSDCSESDDEATAIKMQKSGEFKLSAPTAQVIENHISKLEQGVKEAPKVIVGSAVKKSPTVVGSALKKKSASTTQESFKKFDISDSSDSEEESPKKPIATIKTPSKPVPVPRDTTPPPVLAPPSRALPMDHAIHIPVKRSEEVSIARMSLPVVAEEQVIMETVMQNDVTLLCGETGYADLVTCN